MNRNIGRYEIIGELGRGASGVVYRAHDPLIDRFVAIKAVDFQNLSDEERVRYKARFYQEARAVGRFSHPNLLSIHDMGEHGDAAYIVVELLDGRELQDILEHQKHLTVDETLNIAIQVASGLNYAHQHGVVHRDIKPANIMILKDGQVKIMDFGIARMEASLLHTRVGIVLGSLLYMSPEQVSSRPIDGRSDIFSLGVVLHQMLTGQFPFSGDDEAVKREIVNAAPPKPGSLNPDVPEELDRLVARCLAKDPGERYQNAAELEKDLRSCRGMLLQSQTGLEYHRDFFKSNAMTDFSKIGKWKMAVLITLNAIVSIGVFEALEYWFF